MEKVTLLWQSAHLTLIFSRVVWLNRSVRKKRVLGKKKVDFSSPLLLLLMGNICLGIHVKK